MNPTARKSLPDPEPAKDEILLLYEEFKYPGGIPPRTATSAEVREYLTSVLKNKHSLPDDQVRRLVARWTVGRSYELRSYTAQMYLDVFGRGIGWALYRDIQLEVYRTRPKSTWEQLFWTAPGVYITSAVALVFEMVTIGLAMSHSTVQAVRTVSAMLLIPGSLFCLVSSQFLFCYWEHAFSPEKLVEMELGRCSVNNSAPMTETKFQKTSKTAEPSTRSKIPFAVSVLRLGCSEEFSSTFSL